MTRRIRPLLWLLCVGLVGGCSKRTENAVPAAAVQPERVYATTPTLTDVFRLLHGNGADKRRAAFAVHGEFVEWRVYVIGPEEWLALRGKKNETADTEKSPATDSLPSEFLVAPTSTDTEGLIMRAGDRFGNERSFGEFVSGFTPGKPLIVSGRVLLHDQHLELCADKIREAP
ncbi:MAG: hypothetical protein HY302_01695 [Opitutae bacterium]|nr:hypothetical protein [Opitutae bacterium]